MKISSNTICYGLVVALFLLLKAGLAMAHQEQLLFLLGPVAESIGLLTGHDFTYRTDSGFYFEQLDILIDKSCSGGNFLLLCFAMLSFLALKHLTRPGHRLLAIIAIPLVSYPVTLGVTISRIYVSLIVEPRIKGFLDPDLQWMHEAIGVTTHVSFLIIVYLLFHNLVQSYSHAKPL